MQKHTLALEHQYKPASNPNKPPAIIMLHGYGSDDTDLFSFAEELPNNFAIISLRATLALKPFGYAWYPIYFENNGGKFSDDEKAIVSRELVVKCIDEAVIKYNLDTKNITLLGFSQGTILSFSIGLSYPEKVKNIIGLSGYLNKEIIKPGFEKNDFSNLHVYTSHGSVDQVIPVDWARKTCPFLKTLQIDCTYQEFPVGHGVAPQNFYAFKKWLEAHS